MSKKTVVMLFLIGAVSYGGIEVIWRGYTHFTMCIAGGISAVILGIINVKMKDWLFLYKVIAGSLAITVIELAFGIFFNLILKQNIWDYSHLKFNFLGQICILFTVVWGFICVAALPITQKVICALQKQK